MSSLPVPKYQYHLHTWGGFYNQWAKDIHHHEEGDYFFETSQDREDYLDKLLAIEDELQCHVLAYVKTEGYCCNTRTKLHRVIEWEGKQYYSERDMGINYDLESAAHFLEWKWTPGFNDYPLGEDFDYEANQVKIVQQWISGSFTFNFE